MRDAIDACARKLLAGSPAFTRGNLFYAVRQTVSSDLTRDDFDRALRKYVSRSPMPGLLADPCRWAPRPLSREWDAYFPVAILLVDRPAILDLFVASGVISKVRVAVVCLDGTPRTVIAWLRRGFRIGHRAPVVYLHDAATIIYPHIIEPVATLVRYRGDVPLVYRDLGLPPQGAGIARFADPTMMEGEPIENLEAIPPATLVRYATQEALALVPGDPNMLPLSRESERRRQLAERS